VLAWVAMNAIVAGVVGKRLSRLHAATHRRRHGPAPIFATGTMFRLVHFRI
jgi:hypothetical protein